MRMLCIKGRTHPLHVGLVSGQTYDVSACPPCPKCGQNKSVHADGVVFRRPTKLRCCICLRSVVFTLVPWGQRRFIPFNPAKLGVTIKQANELYLVSPTKVKTRVREKEKA